MKQKIAIIGAGLSGVLLGQSLSPMADVTIFEKSRGVGGRMCTRYADPFYFDHGTQFFTARTKKFNQFIKPYIDGGIISEWAGKVITFNENKSISNRIWFEPHYVANPNMNYLCKKISEQLNIVVNTEIAPLPQRKSNGWSLTDKTGADIGLFDMVISTAPPEQTARLFGEYLPKDCPIRTVEFQGQYTLMLGFKKPWENKWIAARINNSPLEWISINSTKPKRNRDITSILIHSTADWADAHMDDNVDESGTFLLNEFSKLTGIDCTTSDFFATHRWKYAHKKGDKIFEPFYDTPNKLIAIGDWSSASRIEDIWISATKLSKLLITTLSQ